MALGSRGAGGLQASAAGISSASPGTRAETRAHTGHTWRAPLWTVQTGCPRNSRETSGEDTESALVTILGAARCICPPASFLWERNLPPGHEVRHLTQARSVTFLDLSQAEPPGTPLWD